jgi:hypothetical protein
LGATGAAVPANAQYVGMTQGGNLTGLTGTSGNLNVQCANCSGSGVSTADEATFTAGTSLFAGTGGFFQTTATNNALTNGQQGMWQMTANRAGFVNLRTAAGTEIGTSTTPIVDNVTQWAGSALGAMANYGTSPGAVLVPGVNANVTNTVATNGSGVTQPVSVASGQIVNGGDVALGSTTDAAAANGVATATLIGVAKGVLTAAQAAIPAQGTPNTIIGAVQSALSASTTLQNAVTANGNGTDLELEGYGGAVLHVVCSVACSGGTTINFEASFDGTTYVAIQGTPVGGGAPVSTATTTGDFSFNVAGYTDLRARVSAYSAGTITVTGFTSSQSSLQPAALPANQSVNVAQFGGNAVATGTGAGGNGVPRVTVSNDSQINLAANVTATACSSTITTGGTAQNAFTAQTALHGFTIANIDTTEPLWISFTGTAAASGTDSYPLPAATATTFAGFGSFTAPAGFGLNHALSVIAATTAHKFSCTWW